MRGQIMVDEHGWRWIIVEAAHIYFQATRNGVGEWVVAAFRSDGYRRVKGGLVDMMQYLRQTHQFTSELDVPEHIVEYAVESHQLRMEAVEGIAEILERSVQNQNPRKGFRETMMLLGDDKAAREALREQEIGAEIFALIEKAGGQQ